MTVEVPTAVVGLGAIGSAAVCSLAQDGEEVLGLEQFAFGHANGGSHDHSRLIRLAYHSPGYVRLAREAYGAWRALEQQFGERLLHVTGGVDVFHESATNGFEKYATSMSAGGASSIELDAAELERRWPQFVTPKGARILFHEEAGFLAAERACATMRDLASAHGATLRSEERVESVSRTDSGYRLRTGQGTYLCERLVLATGAWMNDLLRQIGYQLSLMVTQEQVTYFRARQLADFQPGRFPVWTWHGERTYYGFPVFGEPAVKAAEDLSGRETTAHDRSFIPDARVLERLAANVHELLPGLAEPLHTKTCLYTMAPDRDFVLGPVPGEPGLLVAVGDGHGFKFAPVLGRLLADQIRGRAECPTEFSADRETLREGSETRPAPL